MTLPEDAAPGAAGSHASGLVLIGRRALTSRIVRELNRYGTVVVVGGAGVGKTHVIEHGVYAQCSAQPEFGAVIRWSYDLQEYLASRSGEFVPNWGPPVLLLADDVAGPESLPDMLLNHALQLIVVSRAPADRWRHLPNFPAVVEVGPFDREESVRFLTTNLEGMADSEADRLAEHLGDLPLALDGAVRWFTPDATVDEFLERAKLQAHVLVGDERPGERRPSLVAEVRRAVEALPDSGRLAPRIALGALALMDGAPYPMALLDGPSCWPQWRSAVTGLPSDRQVPLYGLSTTVVPDLERSGLVRVVNGEVHLGWLTCQLVRHVLSSTDLERARQLAEVMLLRLVPDSKGHAEWRYWASWQASASALNAIDPGCMTTETGRQALLAACDFLIERGHVAEARERLLLLRGLWRRAKNVPLAPRLMALDLLGRASYELGDVRSACRYGDTAFRARRWESDRWRLDPAALSGAAQWALAAGRQEWLVELRRLAQNLPDQKLALRIASFDMLLRARALYGLCLADSINEIVCAQRDILEPEHPHTLFTLDLLARAYHRAGRPEEARHTLSKVLELRTQVLGPGHPHTQATAVELYGQSHELG